MKLIKPYDVTDAMLASSTAPENDYAAWSSATTYAIGDTVIRTETHRIYESLISSNLNKVPEDNTGGTTPAWLDIGPTNRWAMFDNVVGTSTEIASPLTVVLEPGQVGGLALMELSGDTATITMKDASGGTTVYSNTVDLDGSIINSWYDWFFEDYVQLTDVVLTDLPSAYPNCELTISLSISSGNVACGVCKFGSVLTVGDTQWGVGIGITDYSKKDTDAFGNTVIVERSYAKREDFKIEVDPAEFNRIFRTLAALRATPVVWIGTEVEGFLPLIVYGFYKDFNIDVAYHALFYCTLEIEGLI